MINWPWSEYLSGRDAGSAKETKGYKMATNNNKGFMGEVLMRLVCDGFLDRSLARLLRWILFDFAIHQLHIGFFEHIRLFDAFERRVHDAHIADFRLGEAGDVQNPRRSEEHTSELQSPYVIS